MKDLRGFRERLEPLLSEKNSRPFVCKGSPLACRSFVVGLNAATELPHDFFSYWSDEDGFLYKEFSEDYDKTRKRGGNRPRIERISAGLGSCLETNLYAMPTRKAALLKAKDRKAPLIEFLFDEIHPALIFVHSGEPIKFFERMTGLRAGPDPARAKWLDHEFILVGRSGPLYTLGLTDADQLGDRLSSLI
ncbi:hypothetical protein [Aurantimonas marianensis]|uniref:Uncharacterized protein n=1 Tax=Aurantimonas marianensis TaxID=2920428 RepID=A0A9X2KDR4_9HYPH|nr:hypothetical protein [Aurantimonas marianensis]MCP3053874.1 hypothetical protein [Aurantimonas marianensis]